uniref:Uncharacterized protein n=1 Tax=Meloidogyne enterolobii TaxID=390850 RepID=A0A6V7YB13_MELEN|nr:unnamed protein product [Meloidogyne enterolobii]
MCKFSKINKWKGTWMGKIWLAENKEIGLSFNEDPVKISDCNRELVLTDQGYAVPAQQYQILKLKKEIREKRDTVIGAGTVRTTQLAAELTATAVLSTEKVKQALSHISNTLCARSKISDYQSKFLGGAEANIAARLLMNTPYIKGKWISPNILETTTCLPIPFKNITYLANKKCYKEIPVNVTIKDKTIKAFLEPLTLIITEKPSNTPCSYERYVTIFIEKKLIRIDQKTGQYTEINDKYIHEIRDDIQPENKPTIETHAFHNLIINNYSDPRIEMLQMFQTFGIDRKFEQEKLETAINKGQYIHYTEQTFQNPLQYIFKNFFDLNFEKIWIRAVAVYVTYIWIIETLIPFLFKYFKNTRIGRLITTILNKTSTEVLVQETDQINNEEVRMRELLRKIKKEEEEDRRQRLAAASVV